MARQIHHGTDGFLLLGWTLGCLIATWPLPVDAEEGLFRNATGGREGRPGMELRLFRPAIDSKGYFNVNASPTLPHLNLSFGLVLDYALGVGRLEEIRDINTALVRHGLWGTLHFNVGLFNWAVIGLQLHSAGTGGRL